MFAVVSQPKVLTLNVNFIFANPRSVRGALSRNENTQVDRNLCHSWVIRYYFQIFRKRDILKVGFRLFIYRI